MKRRLNFVLFSLVLLMVPVALTQTPRTTTSSCQADQIRTTWGFKGSPLDVERNSITFSEPGTSYPELVIRNVGGQPFDAIGMIIEYRDDQGHVIDRIPILGGTGETELSFRVPFPVEPVSNPWTGALMPGETALVKGVKNGVLTRTCPSTAIVTFLRTQSRGSVNTFAENPWQLGPTPKTLPFVTMLPQALSQGDINILGDIDIDTSGRVLDFRSEDQEHPAIVSWIRDEMKAHWKFNPALVNGQPTGAKLPVMMRIGKDKSGVSHGTLSKNSPVTLISLFPSLENPGKFEVFFGNLSSGSTVQ